MSEERALRDMCFIPCKSITDLRRWIRIYFDVDLPEDNTVDPESNATPMGFIWEIYQLALSGGDKDKTRIIGYAARDAGKCVKKGTMILCRSGLVPVEQVAVGDEVWTGWSWRKVTHKYDEGMLDSATLKLVSGWEVTTSQIHKVWAWRAGSVPDWIPVVDLTPEDLVAVDAPQTELGPVVEEDFDLAYMLGLLAGDGCNTLMRSHGRVIMTTADPFVLGAWRDFCFKHVGRYPSNNPDKPYDWWINSVAFCRYIESLGCTPAYSFEKQVPHFALKNTSTMTGFISGLFDTDGFFQRNQYTFSMTSPRLLLMVQKMLAALGIFANFRSNSKLYGEQRHIVHHLWITADNFPRLHEVGVKVRAGKAGSAHLRAEKTKNTHDGIPHTFVSTFLKSLPTQGGRFTKRVGFKPKMTKYETLSTGKLRDLVNWAENNQLLSKPELDFWRHTFSCRWFSPISVERGREQFYDLSVSGEPSYWSDGLISHNTLSVAVLEVLMLVHCRRNVVHLAAIEAQSLKAQEYVRDFVGKPILRDFLVGDSKRTLEMVRYQRTDDPRDNLNERQWRQLPDQAQRKYECHRHRIEVTVCTNQGVQGKHAPVMVVDEIDVVSNPKAYEDAKMIPSGRDGQLPITVLISTRKSGTGLVQQEIDDAPRTGLVVRHWNVLDVTQRCPPERHLPDQPRVPVMVKESTLEVLPVADWEQLPDKARVGWEADSAFAGCMERCRLFAPCRGRLAARPGRDSRFLKVIDQTQALFREVNAEQAIAQLLSRKPPKSGLIYSRLDPVIHLKTAAQMYELMTGDPAPQHFGKDALVKLFVETGLRIVGGQDYGDTHCFSNVTAAMFGAILLVFDHREAPELETTDQVTLCEPLKYLQPEIYPDMAGKGSIRTFKRCGFNLRTWSKGPGSVAEGIIAVRNKIRPLMSDPEIYFLKDDDGVLSLFDRLSKYHYKSDPITGRISDDPDERVTKRDDRVLYDDPCDALRYMVQNVAASRRAVLAVSASTQVERTERVEASNFQRMLDVAGPVEEGPALDGGGIVRGKGRFRYAI